MNEQDGSENTNWWNIGIGALAGVGVGIALAPVAVPAAAGVLGVGGAIWATTAITVGVISLTSGVGAYFASEAEKQTKNDSKQAAERAEKAARAAERAEKAARAAERAAAAERVAAAGDPALGGGGGAGLGGGGAAAAGGGPDGGAPAPAGGAPAPAGDGPHLPGLAAGPAAAPVLGAAAAAAAHAPAPARRGPGGGAGAGGDGAVDGGDAAALAATAREAKIRADFSDDAKFNETVYKYRLGVARDILSSGNDDEKIDKLNRLFAIRTKGLTTDPKIRADFVDEFVASDFPAPNITDITPLSSRNLRTFAKLILGDTTATTAIKISALDSHIKELTSFQSEANIPNNDAFNFYRGTIQDNTNELNNLKAIATTFLNGFTSGNTPTFESAYDNVAAAAPVRRAAAPAVGGAGAGAGAAGRTGAAIGP